ncbi:MAG: alpha/beta hydrolase, partial [Anaerolineaceae bacterium]|nr:alpha/beta hydrolase [Anaerolineaceae bacterium]
MEPNGYLKMHETHVGLTRVAYYCGGDGPAIVLLHGLSGSSRWWTRNVSALIKHFRVYVVDLIGFGSSRGQRFALAEAPQTILRWMDTLDEESFTLIGHSMGGYIAASAALQKPEQVKKLILVDAVALPFGRTVLRSAWSLLESLVYMPIDFYPVLAADAFRAGPVTLLHAIRDIHQETRELEMAQIKAQTLIVWGENDRLVPLRFGSAIY